MSISTIRPPADATATAKLSKSDQARINGAKSKGPTTPEGKAASSRNALKHGLTAGKHTVLDIENPREYQAAYDAAIDEFKPHSLFALRLVEKLAHLDWRIERLAMLETAYLNFKINEAAELDPLTEAVQSFGEDDECAALVRGWISAVGSHNALELLRRYSSTLQHQFNTTFANFTKLETRAIARRRDRELDPSFLPPYQKPEPPTLESEEQERTAPVEKEKDKGVATPIAKHPRIPNPFRPFLANLRALALFARKCPHPLAARLRNEPTVVNPPHEPPSSNPRRTRPC